MLNEVIHDVIYSLHGKQSIKIEALVNDFDRQCQLLAKLLRWLIFACFAVICVLAIYVYVTKFVSTGATLAVEYLVLAMTGLGLSWTVVDTLPTFRDLSCFNVYAYQVRQLEAAHDLREAADLEAFGLAALRLTDRWLALRIERMKLRLGAYVGGSDKVAILAVIVGAGTIWHNFPRVGSAFEQSLYAGLGAFIGGLGIGGMFSNALIMRLAYQRDLLAIAMCNLESR